MHSNPSSRVEHLPFLLLATREVPAAADDEYAAFQRFTGLDESGLQCIDLTRQRLGRINLNAWSGIILGGSPYCVSDVVKSDQQLAAEQDIFTLLEEIIARDKPFLGCCYGIGTLGSVAGATIDNQHAEPVGLVRVALTEEGARDPLFTGMPTRFDALGGHKEAASTLPAHATLLASSPACPVHAFRIGANVYATQFHPELDVAGICTRIDVYRDHGYFDPDDADTLKREARRHHINHPMSVLRNFVTRHAEERA